MGEVNQVSTFNKEAIQNFLVKNPNVKIQLWYTNKVKSYLIKFLKNVNKMVVSLTAQFLQKHPP